MKILILGAAAGGGFPQWNSNDPAARRARAGDCAAPTLTQSSIAVSSDGLRWALFNASPDLRQQINDNPALHPQPGDGLRASPLAAVALTNADVDHVAGLLNLRESQPLALYAHPRVLDVLARNDIFNVLNPAFVARQPLALDQWQIVHTQSGDDLGLSLRPFAVTGKAPLWLEDADAPLAETVGETLGFEISDGAHSFFYIPGCAAITTDLQRRLTDASLVLFDGTLWRDDEMIVGGFGAKTGRRMGHVSCSGPDGAMAAFAPLRVTRKIFIHINNTNPLLIHGSPERDAAAAAGWEIAFDGMEIALERANEAESGRTVVPAGV